MSEADEVTTTTTYELTCTDCAFSTTVEGTVYDALDAAEEHQDEAGTPSAEHFVNFQVSDGNE